MRFLLPLALLSLAGCTCSSESATTRPPSKGAKARMKAKMKAKVPVVEVTVWLVDQAKLDAGEADPWVPVQRQVGGRAPSKNAVWKLFQGPTPEEADRGLVLFRSGAEGFHNFTFEEGTATLQLRGGCSSEGGTITVFDHIQRTLKGFPEVQQVRLLGPDGSTQGGEGDSRPACLEP